MIDKILLIIILLFVLSGTLIPVAILRMHHISIAQCKSDKECHEWFMNSVMGD